MTDFPVLALLVLLPLGGALVVAFIPEQRRDLILPVTVAITTLPLAVTLWILWRFEVGEPGFQLTERVLWFSPWDVSWNVGIDGISLLLVVLTAVMFPISILASASITKNVKMYMVSMLVLETGLLGVFLALDLLLFFVFFEVTLVPMYLLIGIWGSENRVYAAVKFVLYTALGSAVMLAGIIWLAVIAGPDVGGATFDFTKLLDAELSSGTQ
ncbi:MAG: proton-conducting transporter membrane subunit, partial [Acidimicrobiia bacterium]